LYEVSVVFCEPKEFLNFSDILGLVPFFNSVNLCLLHLYCSFYNTYSQEIEVVLFKDALFWIEMKVIDLQPFKYSLDQLSVLSYMFFMHFSFLRSCMYGYIVHVDCDMSFIDEVAEYGVHHHLEGSW